MALNLWKVAGKPVAYNPLPLGWLYSAQLGLGDYVFRIKLKSNSNGRLQIQTTGGTPFAEIVNLSSTPKLYEKSFSLSTSKYIEMIDVDNKGDIIIDSIELVQKPLPKLTLNGIDPFGAKWTLHPNAKIIDESTLELNATGNSQHSVLNVPCLPNTTYTLSSAQGNFLVGFYTSSLSWIVNLNNGGFVSSGVTFTTPSNCTIVTITLGNGAAGAGKFTFTKPMLNLGTIPAPYSKKTGDKMVLPVAKKNLVDVKNVGLYQQASIVDDGVYYNANGGLFGGYEFPISVINGQTYTLSFIYKTSDNNGWYDFYDGVSVFGANTSLNLVKDGVEHSKVITFTATKTGVVKLRLLRENSTGSILYKKESIQVEPGATPTKYEPYAVQLNPKPKKFVPKKNLLNVDGIIPLTGQVANFYLPLNLKPNTTYTVKSGIDKKGDTNSYNYYGWISKNISSNFDGNYVFHWGNNAGYTTTFTTDSSGQYYFLVFKSSAIPIKDVMVQPQLEEGSTPSPYEPYQLITPRAKTGLSFNGVTDYLQLPSMTMDSIEIECLIDAVQPANAKILDARTGLSNGWINFDSGGLLFGSGWKSVDGAIKGQRTKVKMVANTVFTDDVTIFKDYSTSGHYMKGTIYKVTPYLNGVPVVTYDFENPSNIVGDKVIPNAKNLIPSFEDARWSLHANTQVLGKDVLRLNASGSGYQPSIFSLPCLPNQKYLFTINNNADAFVRLFDSTNTAITSVNGSFTIPSNAVRMQVELRNLVALSGTFDFIQPKLFQLDGKEGTLVEKPTQLNKASKRTLYAKR